MKPYNVICPECKHEFESLGELDVVVDADELRPNGRYEDQYEDACLKCDAKLMFTFEISMKTTLWEV